MLKSLMRWFFEEPEEEIESTLTMEEIDEILAAGPPPADPPKQPAAVYRSPAPVKVREVHPIRTQLDRAHSDIKFCYAALKRHQHQDTLHVVWSYWELLGEPNEEGEAVFRRYILRRLNFIERHARWLSAKIRSEFKKIGFDLDDDGFMDVGVGGTITIAAGTGGRATRSVER